MSRSYVLIVLLIIIIPFLLALDLRSKDVESPLKAIAKMYQQDLNEFSKDLTKLESLAVEYKRGKSNIISVRNQVDHVRSNYKKLEFILDYVDPEFNVKYVNGAPLPKIEPHVAELVIQKPVGLQTLDELVYLDPDNKEEIEDLSVSLNELVLKNLSHLKSKKMEHRYVFEALRYGIVRIVTLGLTGFDTPGSSRGIEESEIAMKSMYSTLRYYKYIAKSKGAINYQKVENLFKEGMELLSQNSDFETFDRLLFVRNVANPLYASLLDLQLSMGIELPHESDQTQGAHNYMSKSIFSLDFLNKSYFSKIPNDDLENISIRELGQKLFFDKKLSKNGSLSCSSCHNPKKAFTDGLEKSKTNDPSKSTKRNSPTLLNSVYYGRYFWDMREYDLSRQIKHVVHNELEFDTDFLDLAEKLKSDDAYAEHFDKAFSGRDKYGISPWSISTALGVYVASLSSWNSEFDNYVNFRSEELSASSKRGFNLFMGKAACGTCHFAPTFSGVVPPFYKDSESEVLGITSSFDTINPLLDDDKGRINNGMINEAAPFMDRAFKTVTVRNTELTAPYMHNGSLKNLEELMHFYNLGGGAGMGLDVPNQTLSSDKLGLSSQEMEDIISFLKSLTDIRDYDTHAVGEE